MTTTTKVRATSSRLLNGFKNTLENPFEDAATVASGGWLGSPKATAPNMYGTSSLETFATVDGLGFTHEDADGFSRYLQKFHPGNFRFRDEGVQFWQYAEPFDDWQDRYGTDAVRVFYHSGHGRMDGSGAFFAALGKEWGGRTAVCSNDVLQGNERLRYVFWSTCQSLRVLDGHSPIRTWAATDRGVRMFFGWETDSWDRPGYGEWFWNHWRSGKSLGTAWLDSGWDGGHDQAPSVAACGETRDEARDRVVNERLFSGAAASRDWWSWRWYGAAKSVAPRSVAARRRVLPSTAYHARFQVEPDALRRLGTVGKTAAIGADRYYVSVASEDAESSRTRLSRTKLLRAATAMISALDLSNVELEASLVRLLYSGGGSVAGDGERTDQLVDGYAVEFRQVIGGRPVINSDTGFVRVHLNADGTVTGADVAARAVADLTEAAVVEAPSVIGRTAHRAMPVPDVDGLLDRAARRTLTRVAHGPLEVSSAPVSSVVVPNSRQVGYVVEGSHAVLGATEGVEVDFGAGYRKKLPVTVLLNG